MFNLPVSVPLEIVELNSRQLPRLRKMRQAYEAKEPHNRPDILSQLQCTPLLRENCRESGRRAAIHWFLKGAVIYNNSNSDEQHRNEILAHLHNYIESGGAKYLQHAEQAWQGTLQIAHNGQVDSPFWVEGAPRRVRLIEKRSA